MPHQIDPAVREQVYRVNKDRRQEYPGCPDLTGGVIRAAAGGYAGVRRLERSALVPLFRDKVWELACALGYAFLVSQSLSVLGLALERLRLVAATRR